MDGCLPIGHAGGVRFFVACGALAAVVLLVGPWPIPDQPRAWTLEEWHASRERALARPEAVEARALAAKAGREATAEARAAAGKALHAGFGRSEIRAPVGKDIGANLAGYGVRAGIFPAHAEEVHDPCFARAIALSNGPGAPVAALILGADILLVNDRLRARVLAELAKDPGTPADRTLFTATHTHSAPGNFSEGAAEAVACGKFREDVTGAIVTAFVEAAREAVRTRAPARSVVTHDAAPEQVRNRYWRSGERIVPLDAQLTTLKLLADDRSGVLAVFGAHATVVGPRRPVISGDWPGGAAGVLERDGGVAIVAAGAVGSQAPRTADGLPDDYARAQDLGARIAARVRDVRGTVDPAPGVSLRTVEIPLPPFSFRFAPEWRASPILVSWLYPARKTAPFSVLRIGREAIIGFPAEISGEVSLDMKAIAARAAVRLTVTSFAGAYHGYVPPDEYYLRWRYENRMSVHGPHFAAFLRSLVDAALPRSP